MNKWISYLKAIEKQSVSGEIAVKMGTWHFENNEWGDAIRLIESGISKGSLDDPSCAYRLLAKCYQLIGREGIARQYYQQASC